ncbi:MAG TPA: DUF2341 domain-containing protein, partial [bacterium]|nr:DUF2341 domain-containing protein [bacterium]
MVGARRIPGDLKIKGNRKFCLTGVLVLFFCSCLQGAGWLDRAYPCRQKITISDGFYLIGSDLKNFPLLLVLSDGSNPLFQKAKPDAADITFTADDGTTRLPHEIEIFSLSPARLVCWVVLPFLYADRETAIYLYYGSSQPLACLPATDVWKEGFLGVWHFQDAVAPDGRAVAVKNSAGKTLTGLTNSNFAVEGKIGQGMAGTVSFDRKDGPEFTPETSFSAEAWAFCSEVPFRTTLSVLGKGSGGRGWSLYWHEAGRWQTNITHDYRNENTRFYLMAPDQPAGQWRHLAVTYEAESRKLRLFVDGLEKASGRVPDGIKEFSVAS